MKRLTLGLIFILFLLPMMSLQAQSTCDEGDYANYSYSGLNLFWQSDYEAALEAFNCGISIAPSSDSLQLPLGPNDPYAVLYIGRAWSNLMLGNAEASHEDFYQWIVLTESQTIEQSLDEALAENPLEIKQGLVYRINFEGRAGQMMSFSSVEAASSITDPLFVLLDPQGNVLVSDDDNGASIELDGNYQPMIADYVLPSTGTYTLVIGQAGLANTGAIELVVDIPAALN